MDCPLISNGPASCKSTSDLLAHTLFSSAEYCRGDWFTLCPRYRQHQLNFAPTTDIAPDALSGGAQ